MAHFACSCLTGRRQADWIGINWQDAPTHNLEPPSTGMIAPVIQRAPSDARNAMTSATSDGCPTRLSACMLNGLNRLRVGWLMIPISDVVVGYFILAGLEPNSRVRSRACRLRV